MVVDVVDVIVLQCDTIDDLVKVDTVSNWGFIHCCDIIIFINSNQLDLITISRASL